MDTRREHLICDLADAANEKDCITAELGVQDKWRAVSYETVGHKGIMLSALGGALPPKISFSPGLEGWYKIYVCLGNYGSRKTHSVFVSLDGDPGPARLAPTGAVFRACRFMQEAYWKSADMTGKNINISKLTKGGGEAAIAWLRFVPMDAGEVDEYLRESTRTDTKRIYATNDMHNVFGFDCSNPEVWHSVLEAYRESDVGSLSMEYFDAPETKTQLAENIVKYYTPELLNELIAHGHDMNLEMFLSLRMGNWGAEYPSDGAHRDSFLSAYPNLGCTDRFGKQMTPLSYIYPEVRRLISDRFSKMAETDCDGVEMIWTRGVPYVLFEQSFCELFEARYGENPRTLPVADPRVHTLHCEILTEFVRELRTRLDAERASRGQPPLKLIARVHSSLYVNRLLGLDVECWAREGLVDTVVVYPLTVHERLEGDVWADAEKRHIDLEKYRRFLETTDAPPILRSERYVYDECRDITGDNYRLLLEVSSVFYDECPIVTDEGYGIGEPATFEEHIDEFTSLTKKYGTKVCFDIMPRQMEPEEYRQRALRLYRAGAEHISMWDTYIRAPVRLRWSMARLLGHKDELKNIGYNEGKNYRVLEIGGQNVATYLPSYGG